MRKNSVTKNTQKYIFFFYNKKQTWIYGVEWCCGKDNALTYLSIHNIIHPQYIIFNIFDKTILNYLIKMQKQKLCNSGKEKSCEKKN